MNPRFICPITKKFKKDFECIMDATLPVSSCSPVMSYPFSDNVYYNPNIVNVDIRHILNAIRNHQNAAASESESVAADDEIFNTEYSVSIPLGDILNECHECVSTRHLTDLELLKKALICCHNYTKDTPCSILIRTIPIFVVETTRFAVSSPAELLGELKRKAEDVLIMLNLLFADYQPQYFRAIVVTAIAYMTTMTYIYQALLEVCPDDYLAIPDDIADLVDALML